jgi:hypothetical protein
VNKKQRNLLLVAVLLLAAVGPVGVRDSAGSHRPEQSSGGVGEVRRLPAGSTPDGPEQLPGGPRLWLQLGLGNHYLHGHREDRHPASYAQAAPIDQGAAAAPAKTARAPGKVRQGPAEARGRADEAVQGVRRESDGRLSAAARPVADPVGSVPGALHLGEPQHRRANGVHRRAISTGFRICPTPA